MKKEQFNIISSQVKHHNKSDRHESLFEWNFDYNDNIEGYIKRLEKRASEKVLKKNEYQDIIVKNFQPTTVLYLLDSNCIYGSGHSSLLFLNKYNEGVYYNTAEITDLVGAIKGDYIPFVIDRKCLSRDNVELLLNTGKMSHRDYPDVKHSMFKYDKFIAIPLKTTEEQQLALRKADQIYYQPGLYNLYERNCNHITQEILAEISNNFSPTKGSAELVVNRFIQLKKELIKMDFNSAKNTFHETYTQLYETGILPTGSYSKGIEFAKERNYKYGKLPIKSIDDLNFRQAKLFDPISDNFKYITDEVKKFNDYLQIEKDIRKIYRRSDYGFKVLIDLHNNLDRGDIRKVYKIINKNGRIMLDETALKKIEYIYDFKYYKLSNIEQKDMQNFIRRQQNKRRELYSPSYSY